MVEVIEVCRVAPPADHSDQSFSPKSLPLTFFDIRWLRFPPPKLLYFYKISPINPSTNSFFDSIVPRLKHSLSLTLQHFLPLAGNLTWPPASPKPVIAYTESDGVSLIIAKSYADFHRLSTTESVAFSDAAECRPLVPNLPLGTSDSEAVPVLAIQVTFFPNDNAFSIGIAAHKAALDGQSFFLFVKSWAHVCKSLGSGDHGDQFSPYHFPLEMKPFYDRTTLFKNDFSKLEKIYSSDWLNSDGPNNRSVTPWETNAANEPDSIRGTFRLSRAMIQELKRRISITETATFKNVSAFSLICAHTWFCLAKAEEISDDKSLVFLVDCRSRLDPPLPATYLGNCIAPRFAVVEREALLGKQGFVAAVNAISEAMKGLENKSVLDGAENWVSVVVGNMHRSINKRRKVYSVASSPRFKVYDTDFGWGRPRKVDVVSVDGTGAMSLLDSRNDDGVEIGIVLKKHQMEAFASLFAQGLDFKNDKYCSSTSKITSSL